MQEVDSTVGRSVLDVRRSTFSRWRFLPRTREN